MVTKRNSLGRGLGSLLNNNNQNNSLFEEININKIEINQRTGYLDLKTDFCLIIK